MIEYTKNYIRRRIESPSHFIQKTFRTVPITHTELKNRFRKKGTKAVVGKLKSKYQKNRIWAVQSVLIPR